MLRDRARYRLEAEAWHFAKATIKEGAVGDIHAGKNANETSRCAEAIHIRPESLSSASDREAQKGYCLKRQSASRPAGFTKCL